MKHYDALVNKLLLSLTQSFARLSLLCQVVKSQSTAAKGRSLVLASNDKAMFVSGRAFQTLPFQLIFSYVVRETTLPLAMMRRMLTFKLNTME